MGKLQRFLMSCLICLLSIIMVLPSYAMAAVSSAPTGVSAEALSSSQIDLQWNAVSGAISYTIGRSTSTSSSYTDIETVTSGTTYTDIGLLASKTYSYKVKVTTSSGTSAYSIMDSATTKAPSGVPETPQNLAAESMSTSAIKLTWSASNDAASYLVWRSTSETGIYSKIATVYDTSFTNSNLQANTNYFYKVQASNPSYGESNDSNVVSSTTLAIPLPPTNLTASGSASNTISLSWTEAVGADSYNIYRASSATGTYSQVGTASTSSFSDTGLLVSTTYYYKVKSNNNKAGLSAYSSEAHATTLAPSGVPEIPTNLDADDTGDNSIRLTWNPSKDATAYYIYRATSSTGTYSNIAKVTTTSYTNTGITANRYYYYKVKAYNDTYQYSDYSNVASAYVTASIPNEPYDLNATAESSSKIDLDWDSVDNTTSYYVYRATSASGTYTKIATVTDESYTDSGLSANTRYYYKVKAHNVEGTSDYSSYAYATTYAYSSSGDNDNRLAGNNRYETAAAIAEHGWTSSYYAVIASGEDFPDALCGAPLAGKYNAPILLTSRYTLETATRDALSNLGVDEVFIIGGTGVISSAVEQKIEDLGISVTRLAGVDRYETSIKVAEKLGYASQAFIATGDNFPDALSIAPIAAMKGYPILLTAKDQLPYNVKTYINNNIYDTVVIGGTGVVSTYVYNQLPSPARLAGIDRYATNMSVIKEYVNDLEKDICYVATGENFPDALAGSALAASDRAPILLVGTYASSDAKNFLSNQDAGSVIAFAGTSVVSDAVLNSLESSTTGSSSVLSSPDNLSAEFRGSSEINLDWDPVSNTSSYYVYRATSYSGTYTKIATVTTSYYYDTNVSDDTTYYYKVQAHNSSGTSAYSSRVSATTDSGVSLAAPTNLSAETLSSSSIDLSWDAVDDATSYYVYRATSSTGTYSKIATLYNEYYTNTGLTSGRTYYYKIQAHNSSDTSSYSTRAYATTD